MAGYDYLRGALRVFRLDRVLAVALCGESFERPEDFDTLAHVERALAVIPGVWSVEVLLETTSEDVRGRIPPAFGVLEKAPGGVLFRAEVRHGRDLGWMAHFLAGLGCSLVVRRPDELREELRRLAAHVSRLAERSES